MTCRARSVCDRSPPVRSRGTSRIVTVVSKASAALGTWSQKGHRGPAAYSHPPAAALIASADWETARILPSQRVYWPARPSVSSDTQRRARSAPDMKALAAPRTVSATATAQKLSARVYTSHPAISTVAPTRSDRR